MPDPDQSRSVEQRSAVKNNVNQPCILLYRNQHMNFDFRQLNRWRIAIHFRLWTSSIDWGLVRVPIRPLTITQTLITFVWFDLISFQFIPFYFLQLLQQIIFSLSLLPYLLNLLSTWTFKILVTSPKSRTLGF